MKRSEIKLNDAQRLEYLKKNRSRLGSCLKADRANNVVSQYEANARHLVATEVIELFQMMKTRGLSLAQLQQLVDEAVRTGSGWKAPELFAS